MEKSTKEIIKTIAIIVLVPTVAVGAYYGFKFVHKKYKENKAKKDNANTDTSSDSSSSKSSSVGKNKDGSVDTTGMSKYTISIPFKLQKELFTDGKFFDAIVKVNYSLISERVDNDEKNNPSVIKVEIMALPSDLPKLNEITQKLNKEISIAPTVA